MNLRQLLLTMIVFTLYGALVYTGYRIFLLALLLVLFLMAASLAQLLWIRRQLSISQTLAKDPVYMDDPAMIRIQIVNRSRWPVAALVMDIQQRVQEIQTEPMNMPDPSQTSGQSGERVPVVWFRHLKKRLWTRWQQKASTLTIRQPLMQRRRILSVFGRSTLREQIPLKTDDPRIYRVGVTRIRIRDPFNIFHLTVRPGSGESLANMRLHVLPRPHERLMFDSLDRIDADGLRPSIRLAEEVNTVDDLRVMQQGDALKRIHWIVSAKQNKWMVKTFEREEQGSVLVLPDLESGYLPLPRQKKHRQAILSVTAAAVRHLLADNLALTLVTSQAGLQAGRADQEEQLLDLLIQLAATPDQPEDPLVQQAHEGLSRLPDDATVVLVSAHPDDDMIRLVRDLVHASHPVFLIYYHVPSNQDKEPTDWFRQLLETGAGLIKVYERETKN